MAATSSRSGMPARIIRKSVGPRSRPSALRQIVISRDSCRAERMARGVSFRGGGKPPELRLSSASLPLRVKWSTAFKPASAEELKAAHLLVLNAPDGGFLDGREARASGLSVVGWVGKFRRAEALVITCFGKLTGTVTDIKSGAQLRFQDYVQGERGLQFQRGGHWLPAIEIVCWEDRSGTHHSALCSDVRFVIHDDAEATLTIDGERQDIEWADCASDLLAPLAKRGPADDSTKPPEVVVVSLHHGREIASYVGIPSGISILGHTTDGERVVLLVDPMCDATVTLTVVDDEGSAVRIEDLHGGNPTAVFPLRLVPLALDLVEPGQIEVTTLVVGVNVWPSGSRIPVTQTEQDSRGTVLPLNIRFEQFAGETLRSAEQALKSESGTRLVALRLAIDNATITGARIGDGVGEEDEADQLFTGSERVMLLVRRPGAKLMLTLSDGRKFGVSEMFSDQPKCEAVLS